MPGTVKIWWHDGATQDARNNSIPVVNEPELGFETVAISDAPSSSGPAPQNATVALIQSDTDFHYRVRTCWDDRKADPADCKPIRATGNRIDFIGVQPGFSISFIEA